MLSVHLPHVGRLNAADGLGDRATCVKMASRWQFRRAGYITRQHYAVAFAFRVSDRSSRQQCLCIRMMWRLEQSVRVREFYQAAQVHHSDASRDVTDHSEIVGDEQISDIQPLLQVLHQIHDLGLNRNIQSRHRLVSDDQLRRRRQGTRDRNALALSTRELEGMAMLTW